MSLTAAGSLVMLFGMGGFAFALGSGYLVRLLGEIRLVRIGGTVAGLALVLTGLAPAWTWAIPACAALGLGFYMLHNTLQINATQMAPERRGAAVSSFAACFFLGQSTGIAFAAWLITRLGTSVTIAVFGVGLLLVSWYFSLRKARQLADVQV
jgi:predicted MFS family arabinose efflux permease